ncbi:hypothetical protein DQ04_05881020 [Trypanosoma grayi]|uniref:hypothetical protein n=1 Tax=Trypanosoma grayi TaxID=71804 RepID=UPI0004F43F32|nr:hypothetical protein DQ04_05881020 [Trypanosoma grayi]KEG09069.1 hypothetical protein DQ04_05881020 [Trypanosoma grayi]
MTVSRASLETLEERLVENGEARSVDAALCAAHIPDRLGYGDFIEFFQVRWPHLSRAHVASLLLLARPGAGAAIEALSVPNSAGYRAGGAAATKHVRPRHGKTRLSRC